MFISSMWDVKENTHYSKRVGHELPGVVAVLCDCMGGYREGDKFHPRRHTWVELASSLCSAKSIET